ncbi:hypothetical protein BDZ97DRAFT_1905679 [Flammula alnicola]|nr:hypothetical protein BDZ97DRAFT_1905679 [Flammula alnicola]
MSRAVPQSLDILRSSPVRGQLEPYDPRTPHGCRYIQTTDTPDELKVLLPPGTTSMYEQLLKLENYELSKKPSVSWERIMEIRHLKDRMIRKCQKLAKTAMPIAKTTSRGDTFVFQTFVAPSDFRLKEMEKWFREQQKRANSVPPRAIAASKSATYDLSIAAVINKPGNIDETEGLALQTITYHTTLTSCPIRTNDIHSRASTAPYAPNDVFSPPPLPVLLLSQRDDYGLGLNSSQPEPVSVPPAEASPLAPPAAYATGTGEPSTLRPSLSRKNSCIKRNSIGELKTVSWADNDAVDLDNQFRKYASAAREAQASGKWEEVRVLYLEQIAGLESLHLQVKEGLEHLRSETDHLQRIDETIRHQRGALDATFQEFEQKQTLFQEKVQEALAEANDALARQGIRRELEPINES